MDTHLERSGCLRGLITMLNIEVVMADGAVHEVQAPVGQTLLQAVLNAGLDGFAAECGGCCVCATCHCYIDEKDLAKLASPQGDEDQMLYFTATERRPNSRLSCQVKLEEGHEGLRIHMPDRQY